MGRSVIPKPLRWGKYQPVLPRVAKKSASTQSISSKYRYRSASLDSEVQASYEQLNNELQARIQSLETIISDMQYPKPAQIGKSNQRKISIGDSEKFKSTSESACRLIISQILRTIKERTKCYPQN